MPKIFLFIPIPYLYTLYWIIGKTCTPYIISLSKVASLAQSATSIYPTNTSIDCQQNLSTYNHQTPIPTKTKLLLKSAAHFPKKKKFSPLYTPKENDENPSTFLPVAGSN